MGFLIKKQKDPVFGHSTSRGWHGSSQSSVSEVVQLPPGHSVSAPYAPNRTLRKIVLRRIRSRWHDQLMFQESLDWFHFFSSGQQWPRLQRLILPQKRTLRLFYGIESVLLGHELYSESGSRGRPLLLQGCKRSRDKEEQHAQPRVSKHSRRMSLLARLTFL